MISEEEVREVVFSGEIIEDYSEDVRGSMNEVTCFLSLRYAQGQACFDAKNKKSESANGGEAP